jgi:hypothetical protein
LRGWSSIPVHQPSLYGVRLGKPKELCKPKEEE